MAHSFLFETLTLGAVLLTGATLGTVASIDSAGPPALRICADGSNLPLSDRSGAGFENQIASLVAGELHEPLSYTWSSQADGSIQDLNAHRCDIVLGVAADDHRVRPTRAYYRSTYVFVQRADLLPPIQSLDDPRLSHLRIGVHAAGGDHASQPPGIALARRGLLAHLSRFSRDGLDDRSASHPLVDAVAEGSIDLAVAWGPLVGDYTRHTGRVLVVTVVPSSEGTDGAPFMADIAMGVRSDDSLTQRTLDAVLLRRHDAIAAILRKFSVPEVQDTRTLAALGTR
ncbi:MAG: quinoprotein dehydrogenase-associated putative ABC transporter substrate-binding protein [Gemmatimonadota bacterium]